MALKQDSETPESTLKDVDIAATGTHFLKIKGFSFTKGMGVGKFIASDTFSAGGHSWFIKFYPNGQDVNNDENGEVYVSLFIGLVNKSIEGVEAYTEYALLDQTGNKWTKKNKTKFTMHGPKMIKTSFGYAKFYKRTELETSQFIKNDCLNIQCTVFVVKKDGPKPVAQLSELEQRYEQLLASKETSDVTFIVEGVTFYAHKAILSIWSPVFKAQFYGPLKEENTQCIQIEEIQAPVFKALLHFIYCGVIPEDLVGLEYIMMIQHLLVTADRYGSERLKSLCESILCRNIDVNMVASTIALAEQHECIKLKSMCLEFILLPGNLYDVMQTDGYKNLKETCPSVIDYLFKSIARERDDLIKSLTQLRDCTCVTFDASGNRVK